MNVHYVDVYYRQALESGLLRCHWHQRLEIVYKARNSKCERVPQKKENCSNIPFEINFTAAPIAPWVLLCSNKGTHILNDCVSNVKISISTILNFTQCAYLPIVLIPYAGAVNMACSAYFSLLCCCSVYMVCLAGKADWVSTMYAYIMLIYAYYLGHRATV